MKKLFLLAWPIALAAVSCSNEEVVSVNNDANEIKFAVVSENATRANSTETFCNNAKPADFDVWAMTGTKSYFAGVNYSKQASGKWEATDQSSVRFWPNGADEALDFYAMRNYGTPNWTPAGTAKMTTEFTVKSDVDQQLDFIYAVETGKKNPATTENPHNGLTTLNFRHALSQIVFTAQNTNKHLAVEITKVEIINVASGGTCTLPTTSTSTNKVDHNGENVGTNLDNIPDPTCTWAPESLTGKGTDYSVATETCKMVGVTAVTNLTNGNEKLAVNDETGKKPTDNGWVPTYKRYLDKAMLLIPQETTKATLSPTSKPSDVKVAADGGSMIAVHCTIWNLNEEGQLKATDVELYNGVAYIPFKADWKAGKKYIYNLVFGKANGGYTPDGKDILVPISFDITVDDFTTVVKEDVNMNL